MSDTLTFRLKQLTDEENLKKIFVLVSKTRSSFNKDINDLPRIKAVAQKYITEAPFLADMEIVVRGNFPNNFYSIDNKKIILGLFNADLLAHELEHALSLHSAILMPSILKASKAISSLSSAASIPLPILGAAMKLMGNNNTKGFVNEASDILALIHGLATTPTLFEEGKANMGVMVKSPDKMKSMGNVLPAYGTYLANAMLPMLGYQALKFIK
jgi:hypothetical protein